MAEGGGGPNPLQAAGAIYKGVGQYQSQIYNARVADANAIVAARDGVAEEARIRDVARQAIGEQVASQGENGFQQGTGSAIDALWQSQVNATLDALTVRRSAAAAAMQEREKAKLARKGAHEAIINTGFEIMGIDAANKVDWASARAGQTGTGPAGSYGGYGGGIVLTPRMDNNNPFKVPTVDYGKLPPWGTPGHEGY